MKLFVVVFGAALAASMVAAGGDTPDNANFGEADPVELMCTGDFDDYEVVKLASCGSHAVCDGQAEIYALLNGLTVKAASCCSFGDGYYDEGQASTLCKNVNDNCYGALENAEGVCNNCIGVFEEDDEPVQGPCCAPCCEEPQGSLWEEAIVNELGPWANSGETKDIAKEWFLHTPHNDRHIHFHNVESCGTYPLKISVKDIVGSTGGPNVQDFTCYKACCECCFDLQLTAMQSSVLNRDNTDPCGNKLPDTLLYPQDVNRVPNANGAVCFAEYASKKIVVVLADFYRMAAWYYDGNFAYTYEAGADSQLLFTYMCNQKATIAHAISPKPAPKL